MGRVSEEKRIENKKHTILRPLLEVEMLKSARSCGAKHMSKSKCARHTRFGALLAVECTPLWREAHFQAKMLKAPHYRTTFGRFAWQAQRIAHLVKSEQNVRIFVAFPKTMAGVGHLKVHFPWQAQYKRHVHQRC